MPFRRLDPLTLTNDIYDIRFYSDSIEWADNYKLDGRRFDLMIGFNSLVACMCRANPNCEVILKYDEDAVGDQIIDYIERNEGKTSMSYETLMLKKEHFIRKIHETFDKYKQVGFSYHIYNTSYTIPKDYVRFEVSFSFKYPDRDGYANGITFARTIRKDTEYREITWWVIAEMKRAVNYKYDLEKRLDVLNNSPSRMRYEIGKHAVAAFDASVKDYCERDVFFLNEQFGLGNQNRQSIPGIDKVTFNDPATVVFWKDGTKTIVQARNGEKFDPEKGLAMAISKKALGNTHNYYETFLKEVGRYEKQQAKAKKTTSKTKKQGDKK